MTRCAPTSSMRSQNRRRRALALLALGAPASGLSTGFVRPFCVGVARHASGKSSVVSEVVRLLSHASPRSRRTASTARCRRSSTRRRWRRTTILITRTRSISMSSSRCSRTCATAARVELPNYDFVTHSRLPTKTAVEAPQIVIFEGLFTLYDERLRTSTSRCLSTPTPTCGSRRVAATLRSAARFGRRPPASTSASSSRRTRICSADQGARRHHRAARRREQGRHRDHRAAHWRAPLGRP